MNDKNGSFICCEICNLQILTTKIVSHLTRHLTNTERKTPIQIYQTRKRVDEILNGMLWRITRSSKVSGCEAINSVRHEGRNARKHSTFNND